MQKVYILDTNTLIENPDCLETFRNGQENRVLIPYSVIMELDRLKTRPDLNHIIAVVGDRLEHDQGFEVVHIPDKTYAVGKTNDDDILEDIRYAFSHAGEFFGGLEPVVVSNDRMFRVRLGCEGIRSQEYKDSKPFQSLSQQYTGFVGFEEEKTANCFWWDQQNKLWFEGTGTAMDYEHTPWAVKPRNVYQNCAMELMLSRHIDVVTLQSEAGFGKTHIALACAFELVLQKPREYGKIFIFKPVVEIGERLGFLPGDEKEKLAPYMRGITDLIMKLHGHRPANALFTDPKAARLELNPKRIEVISLNFIRGMNIEDAIVIIDEAQNITRYETRALLTRMGEHVKCFVLGDTHQVDHPYLNAYNNGLNWIVTKFKGHRNYGHMVLKGSRSRGPITDLVLKTDL
ncbi:MAG TPA: PhoH family protein [Deltaproteobacteria bacterium]|nr:PhoH family protein [Deltaproteobacteria bacterium]HPR54671.1 PhoH family protein [Deltaproteobacteria bacterium]HXK46664.1 PhoH family protein [Deltaproteobacteria bacterium]